ncbi:MAG: transglutaminase domain-containing protein [Saprospiraceae bacterium]
MPFYRIQHITRYTYPAPAIDGINQIMLFPIQDAHQEVQNHELRITNNPSVEEFFDHFGNKVGIFSLVKPHHELTIRSEIEIFTHTINPPEDVLPATDQWQELSRLQEEFPFMDFLKREILDSKNDILAMLNTLVSKADTPMTVVKRLAEYIFQTFDYQQGITSVETSVDEIWKLKAGVCQDFAHLMLVMLRKFDIPARYVSGYICPKNHDLRGEGATHAWVEAYIPFYGWLGVDPTNNCLVSDRHVRLAVGRNFSDCTPVKGTYKGSGEHTLEVSVTIENGVPKSEAEKMETPVFGYTVKKEETPLTNSYRQFMEMQMQQ